jgi:hypothetical protein
MWSDIELTSAAEHDARLGVICSFATSCLLTPTAARRHAAPSPPAPGRHARGTGVRRIIRGYRPA